MQIIKIMAIIPPVGLLLALGACSSPVAIDLPTPAPASEPAPKPPAFTTSNLTIISSEVAPGENVTVGVIVTNTGEQPGIYTVVLNIYGGSKTEDVKTKDVTLAGGANQEVTFTIYMSKEGIYVVTIDQLTGNVRVDNDLN